MPLIQNSYGKGLVRVMRVHPNGNYNEVRELTVQTMLTSYLPSATISTCPIRASSMRSCRASPWAIPASITISPRS
jgi:hypothetical protein